MSLFGSQTVEEKVAACEGIVGSGFSDKHLLLEAINMSGCGVIFRQEWIMVSKNTRMAVYRDSASELNLCARWFRSTLTTGKH